MTAAISAILPSIVSGVTFSTRRGNRGANSNNMVEGTANCIIAGGQSFKAFECSAELAKNFESSGLGNKIITATEAISEYSKGDKVLKGLGNGLKFVGEYVNHFITLTEGLRVLCADDKEGAAVESAFALGTMFTFEKCAKKVLGISKFTRVNGVITPIPQKALYEEVKVVKECVEKFVNWCSKTNVLGHSLEHLPSVLRGLGFVCASIAGYRTGAYIGRKIVSFFRGEKEDNTQTTTAKTVEFKPTYNQQPQETNQTTAKTIDFKPIYTQQTLQETQQPANIQVQLNPSLLSYTQARKTA